MKAEDDADVESVDQEAEQEKYESGQKDPGKLQICTGSRGPDKQDKSPQNEEDVTEDDENFNRF